jgi:hypothetical protein
VGEGERRISCSEGAPPQEEGGEEKREGGDGVDRRMMGRMNGVVRVKVGVVVEAEVTFGD